MAEPIPHRRETDVTQRLDKQDAVLEEMRVMMIEHRLSHAQTDPALLELIDVLKGAKLLQRVAFMLVAAVGAAWAFFVFIWDHVRLIK